MIRIQKAWQEEVMPGSCFDHLADIQQLPLPKILLRVRGHLAITYNC